MPFNATVLSVMIASPSDVIEERRIFRGVIHEWNDLNARDKGIVLLPVGWETHATPELSGRPQGIINRQVTDRCDWLVAVFWNRLGTPTGEEKSGTVEEIRRHVAQDKIPPMLYFSDVPAKVGGIDLIQRKELDKIREEFKADGLVWSYETREEFRQLLFRHLTQRVATYCEQHEHDDVFVTDVPPHLPSFEDLPGLSDERELVSEDARELLLAAAGDNNGMILCPRIMEGLIIKTASRNFAETGDRRSEARWKAALDELCDTGLIEPLGYKGEVFQVTHDGFQLADQLREKAQGAGS